MFELASKCRIVQLLLCSFNSIKSRVFSAFAGLCCESVVLHVCCVVPFLVGFMFSHVLYAVLLTY